MLSWRSRAKRVIPNGMYGHQNAASLPEGFPQFMERGEGCRVWDVDGNEYIDFMCSYGPVVLGHKHEAVEAAARAQAELADCQNGPSHLIVELSELLVKTVKHADWAMFQKNGTDATTACVTIARATTKKRKVLVAKGAYHGQRLGARQIPMAFWTKIERTSITSHLMTLNQYVRLLSEILVILLQLSFHRFDMMHVLIKKSSMWTLLNIFEKFVMTLVLH